MVSGCGPGDSSEAWTLDPTTCNSRTVAAHDREHLDGQARDGGAPICSDSIHEGSSRTVAVHDSVHEEAGDGIVRETNPRTVDIDLRPVDFGLVGSEAAAATHAGPWSNLSTSDPSGSE